MKKLPISSFRIFIPLLISGFSLVLGISFGLLYHLTLVDAHQKSKQHLGAMYATQLAESGEQALILRDKLSLQAKITQMTHSQGVSGAAIKDMEQNYLSRSRSFSTNSGELYTAPIMIDGQNAGFAEVILDSKYLDTPLQEFILYFFILWALLSLAMIALAYTNGKKWSAQVSAIMNKLPSSLRDTSNLPELDRLEEALTPLFVGNIQQGGMDDNLPPPEQSLTSSAEGIAGNQAILSVKIRNLTRLQAELSSDNFSSLMTSLDQITRFILKLYEAERLAAHDGTIYLLFSSPDQIDDYCLRALYSGFAFQNLIKALEANRGLKIECSLAITSGGAPRATNRLQHDLQREKQIEKVTELLEIAAADEILLDRETGTHPALDNTALLEPLTPDQKMFRCEGLAETAENLVKRQLAFYKGSSDRHTPNREGPVQERYQVN